MHTTRASGRRDRPRKRRAGCCVRGVCGVCFGHTSARGYRGPRFQDHVARRDGAGALRTCARRTSCQSMDDACSAVVRTRSGYAHMRTQTGVVWGALPWEGAYSEPSPDVCARVCLSVCSPICQFAFLSTGLPCCVTNCLRAPFAHLRTLCASAHALRTRAHAQRCCQVLTYTRSALLHPVEMVWYYPVVWFLLSLRCTIIPN